MEFFTPTGIAGLYVASSPDRGWLAYALLSDPPEKGFGLSDALSTYQGTFVFASRVPAPAQLQAVFTAVSALIQGPIQGTRAFLWLTDLNNITADTAPFAVFDSGATQLLSTLLVPLTQQLQLQVSAGTPFTLDGTALSFTPSSQGITFIGMPSLQTSLIAGATLPLTGPQRGGWQFDVFVARLSLLSLLRVGFQFVIPVDLPARSQLAGWYPLADPSSPDGADMIGLSASVDPSDVHNTALPDRTYLAFTGQNQDQPAATVLASYYRTSFGHGVSLVPVVAPAGAPPNARLWFTPGIQAGAPAGTDFVLSPAGDFTLQVDQGAPGATHTLLMGLSATEGATFASGASRIRFTPGQGAWVPSYPFPTTSPVGPPPSSQPLLAPEYATSWATLVSDAAPNLYGAQPRGATLYGHPRDGGGAAGLLVNRQSDYKLPPPSPPYAFPLIPYAGVAPDPNPPPVQATFDATQFQKIESAAVAPSRRSAIAAAGASPSGGPAPYPVTTPTGLIALVGADGCWTSLQLGRSGAQYLQFIANAGQHLDPHLQQAFLTNQLLLVATNAQYLQTPAAGFDNTVNVGGWQFTANVGKTAKYGDYNNVLIVKGRPGRLVDLVANPKLWTQSGDFAVADSGQLLVLSQWLQDYLATAQQQVGNPYFDYFNEIICKESWTGILVLKADVAPPAQLQGLLAGMNPSLFYAHHLGVEITPIDGVDIALKDPSSLFGLVYYVDPAFKDGVQPVQTVPPPPGALYDFRVLTLKALFQNTAVKRFESRAQLTLNQLFGSAVAHTGDHTQLYNTILLAGSYQHQNGQNLYVLNTTADNNFYLKNNVLTKVELTQVQFSTLNTAPDGTVNSRFDFWGFMDFGVVKQTDGTDTQTLDVFSFGSAGGTDTPRSGLCFSGLGLNLSSNPSASPPVPSYTFDTGKLAFDIAQSTPRQGSLYRNFSLELDGLAGGDAKSQPADQGYLPVIAPNITLTGVSGTWYGLRLRLNLGTPGALAGKVGLNSYLLAAWSPASDGSGYSVALGLELPGTGGGAKLISLQNVLKLAIGTISLYYLPKPGAFLLLLNQIALQFLGLLKLPPNGATAFYLFGNPKETDSASALGWYAVYSKNPGNPSAIAAALQSPTAEARLK